MLAFYFGGDQLLKEMEGKVNPTCPYLKGDKPGEHWCQILEEDPSLGEHVALGGGCGSSAFNDDRGEAKRLWARKYTTLRGMLRGGLELTLTIRHKGSLNDERAIAGSEITEIGKTGFGMGEELVENCRVEEDPDWIAYPRVLKVEDVDGTTLWEPS